MNEAEAGRWQRATGSKKIFFNCRLPAACCLLSSLLSGCGGTPNAANIQLRKENQKLTAQISGLNRQHEGDLETIQACEGKNAIQPAVSQERLEKLFTAHDLSLGRLTGGHFLESSGFDDGLTVYAVPTDEQGEPLKAAGSFKVDAFDLDDPGHPLIGSWSFDVNQTRNLFYAHLSLYTYVLQCPWQTLPRHRHLTLHVVFDDELTGRELTAQREIKVNPPPSPATVPGASR